MGTTVSEFNQTTRRPIEGSSGYINNAYVNCICPVCSSVVGWYGCLIRITDSI